MGRSRSDARLFVAIAGPPGAGKSTVAEALVSQINATEPGTAVLLPMDGYHFDDRVLRSLGRLDRKGAPDTFDVDGLRHMMLRLREKTSAAIAVPVFDRDLEIARAGARLIGPEARMIVVEGNYLLLDQEPWRSLVTLFDVTVFLDVPIDVLRERLERRWRKFQISPEEIRRKVEENDLPNGEMVMRESLSPDVIIGN